MMAQARLDDELEFYQAYEIAYNCLPWYQKIFARLLLNRSSLQFLRMKASEMLALEECSDD